MHLALLSILPYPFSGASPDGSCCGEGLLVIKCPYSIRVRDPAKVTGGDFYLKITEGCLQLSRKHNYFKSKASLLCVIAHTMILFVGLHMEYTLNEW